MADHKEINQFFEELLSTLTTVSPNAPDIEEHVLVLRRAINSHKEKDKYAEALADLNDTEIEELLRFVERPRGRHHIHEIKELWQNYGAEQAGRLFLKHYYQHNKNYLLHAKKLKALQG